MRRATALLLPLLTACLLAAGCEDPVAPEFRWVYGTWEWTSSCCDIAGGAKTPETEGYGMRLVLRRENRAELFRNDSLRVRTRFTVRERGEPEGVGVVRFESAVNPGGHDFSVSREYILVRRDDDSFELRHPSCADCWGSIRFRRNP